MPVLIIILVIVGVSIAIYFSYLQQKKRREAMAALAAELGWAFHPGRDTSHDDEYAHFEIFRRGHSRAAYNTLCDEITIDERRYPAKMGDFTYKVTRSSGKSTSTTTYRFSYLILHIPFQNLPDLLIRREGMFDKIAGAFGFDDIDFESSQFSREFHVKSPDKRFAYDVITPRMMEFLMSSDAMSIDIEQGRCCISNGKHKWEPFEFKARVKWIAQFFNLWPEHLTEALEDRAR